MRANMTSVGQRHTPVEKGAVVKMDPKTAEAYARNHKKTRVRVNDPNSASD
jgi:hypothetical protein